MEIEGLINGIVLLVFGITFSIYSGKLARAGAAAQNTLLRELGKKKVVGSGYILYGKIFILILGIALVLGGAYQIYSSLK